MRAELEQKLNAMQPVSPEVRELMTFEGFTRWYRRMQHLYPTKVEAYEALEFHYERLTGRRRYSEHKSFSKALYVRTHKSTSVKE